VSLDLNLTSIKYKNRSSLNRGNIDWRKICEEDEQRKLYNKYLLQFTSHDMSYKEYCDEIVHAGETTATVITHTCKGWYRASEDILAPAIQEKNRLRHRLHNNSHLSPEEIANIKTRLNHDLVELAKARWYKGVCGKIHKMHMDPRLAWEKIRILTGGETAHHTTNVNMSMRLINGELASNAKENMSVFGAHFHKVLNNNRPVDQTVLDLLEQKSCMTSIDNPIRFAFAEVKRAINKLKKGKAPGLNGIPPEALKAMDTVA
jgi:hypothetical protein